MRGNKYGARKTVCIHGHTHASKREAVRCVELHILQQAGQILGLSLEPQIFFEIKGKPVKHPNGRRVGYKGDFGYVERGVKVIEEVKPASKDARGRDYALRIAIAKALYPSLDFREVA